MNRRNQILSAVLVVQIVVGALVFWPRSTTSAGSGPLFADFKAADVVNLTISDANGEHITLARNGDNWVLPEAGDYPADSTKIAPLLNKVESLKTNRLVTQTDASHKRLKVASDDFDRLIEVKLQDGTSHKLYLGSTAGVSTTHIRADDQSEVYLASNLSSWDVNTQASAWIDTLYFTVPQTATVALTLQNQNGTFEFEKEGDNWTMKGLAGDEKLNVNNVTTLVSQATAVQMVSPIGKESQDSFGLDAPLAVVTLKTKEGDQEKTYTLKIGAKSDDGNSYVASSSESPYYVRVAEYLEKSFGEKNRDDFLQLPPTPTPTAGSESAPTP
jgi:YD repeat-containing protein